MVTTAEPAAETPARSAASAALARARRSRKDADAALSEAVKAQKAAEQLVVAPDKIRARIIELEGKTVGAVEPWATTGGVRQATLPTPKSLKSFAASLPKPSAPRTRRGSPRSQRPLLFAARIGFAPVVTRRPKLAPRPFIDVLARESSTRLCELRWFPD